LGASGHHGHQSIDTYVMHTVENKQTENIKNLTIISYTVSQKTTDPGTSPV